MTDAQLILVIVAIAVVAAVAIFLLRAQRSRRLRQRFGPEYGRAVLESGGTTKGEERLSGLEKRVARFNIRPLSTLDRERFAGAWRMVQAKFVDEPKTAVEEADVLIGEVMKARGYPVADFDQQAADLSVHHASVVEHYRAGHEVCLRHAQGRVSTEDLRQAMIHYHRLFSDLVSEPEGAPSETAVYEENASGHLARTRNS